MINLKTEKEIEIMKEGGSRLREVVNRLRPLMRPGVTTNQIDKEATRLIKQYGGEPSFKKVKGYFWSVCVPVNEQIVHTPPSGRILKQGDVLTVDIGMYYRGYHTDYADTVVIGGCRDKKTEEFLSVGRQTLEKAISQAKAGNRLGKISETIEKEIKGHGYHVIESLTGHGVGKELHEEPFVLGFLDRPIEKTPLIKAGLVIAIEIIYAKGTKEIAYENGGDWSIVTRDGSLSACFEHTVAITDKNTFILT